MAGNNELTVLVKKSDGTFERVPLSELAKRPKVAPAKSVESALAKPAAPVVVLSATPTTVISVPAVIQMPVVKPILSDSRPLPPTSSTPSSVARSVEMTAPDAKSLLEDDNASEAAPLPMTTPNRRESQVEAVLKKLSFSVPPDFNNRLRSVILLRLKEIRGEELTRATALRSIKDGGLGLTETQALELERVCAAVGNLKKASSRSASANFSGGLKKWEARPALTTINDAFNLPTVSAPNNAFVHPLAATVPVVATSAPRFEIGAVAVAHPTMADVVMETATVGPLEEIKSFTLEDFRRLAPDPTQAAKRLAQKFLNLKEESVILFWQAQSAWRASALYLSYVSALAKDLLGAHYGADGSATTLAFKPAELSALITMEKDLGM